MAMIIDKLGIVVVNYKTPANLAMCLLSIRTYVENFELIIVDNGEDQKSREVIQHAAWTESTFFEKNIGFCKAVNKGVKELEAEYFAIMPADCMVTQQWEGVMNYTIRGLPRAGIVGPMCTQASGPQGIEIGGMIKQPIEFQRVILNGAVMKKEVFIKMGGLDESFPNKGGNFCDDDIGRRYVLGGYKNYIVPVLIFHSRSASYQGDLDKYQRDINMGRDYFTKKWFKKG